MTYPQQPWEGLSSPPVVNLTQQWPTWAGPSSVNKGGPGTGNAAQLTAQADTEHWHKSADHNRTRAELIFWDKKGLSVGNRHPPPLSAIWVIHCASLDDVRILNTGFLV